MIELIDQYVVVTVTTALAFQRDECDLPPNDDNVISFQNNILENLNNTNNNSSEENNETNQNNSSFISTQMHHKHRQKSTEAPKPKHFIHTEYSLLGEHSNKSETDVITYGTACKFFRNSSSADKSSGSSGGGDTRLIKTYDDPLGDKVWCVFKHQHTLRITDDILNNLYKNKIKIKIWDNKDRVMPRARFERPKAIRYFDQVGLILDEIRHQTILESESQNEEPSNQRRSTTTGRHSKMTSSDRSHSIFMPENPSEIFPQEAINIIENPHDSPFSVPNSKINPAFNPYLNKVCFSSVYEQRVTKSAKKIGNNHLQNAHNKISKVSLEHGNMVKAHDRSVNMHKKEFTLPSDNFIKKPSSRPYSASKLPHMTVEIDLSVLFAGFSDVTSRGVPNEHALQNGSGVRDCFVTFAINKDLLSEAQQKEFNPLVFRIIKLMNMPRTPYDFHELSKKCRPVHIEYSFLGNKHKTTEKPHAREILFDDVKVILAGKVDINSIIEELQVKDFEFEIHDRDQHGTSIAGPNCFSSSGGSLTSSESMTDKYKKPILFGEESTDQEFGKRLVIKELTNESDLKSGSPGIQNCYGYSKLNLKPLLSRTNHKVVATVPVLPASVKSSAKIMNGHYLQAGTELQIEIHSAKPLLHDQISPKIQQQARPFQIICLIFDHAKQVNSEDTSNKSMNISLIKKILKYVNSHNLKHFGLDPKNSENLEFFASNDENPLEIDGFSILKNRANFLDSGPNSKFAFEKASNKWFSGYHIDDIHTNSLIVLNAHHSEIEKFLATFNEDFYENPNCDILQDSSLNLTNRTFNSNHFFYTLLVSPFNYLLSSPKMYVERSKPLLQAIMSIWNLKNCKTLREAVKTDCFIDDEQLILIEKKIGRLHDDFGHFMDCEFEDNNLEANQNSRDGTHNSNSTPSNDAENSKEREPLDHQNEAFKNYKKAFSSPEDFIKFRDIIKENRKIVSEMSEVVKDHKICRPLSTFDQYADPVMEDLKNRQNIEISDRMRSLWAPFYTKPEEENLFIENPEPENFGFVQQKRFTAYGHKTAQQSNRHDKIKGINHNPQCGFNIAKSIDCNTTWIENRLHNNKLKPTLPERDQKLLENLKLHFPKIDVFDKDCPVSIILGGDKQNEEIQKVKLKDLNHWKDKLISDPTWKFHRQNTGTEQKFKLGPEFQLDKLQGILKIEEKKEKPSLNYLQRYPAHDIPALPVNTRLTLVDGIHVPNFKGSGVKEVLEAEKRMPFMDF